AIVWMLQAVMPSRWAWLGGFLVAAQYVVLGQPFLTGTFGYWSQSYWGGALTAAGGALVYGALPRLLRKARVGPAVAMGMGLVILMATRPFEGLIAVLPAAYLMARWLWKRRFARRALLRGVLPIALVLSLGVAAMGTYNKAVTGKATEMPWATHYEQYCVFPVFLWQDVLPPKPWRHPELAVFYGEVEVAMHERHSTPLGLLVATLQKLARFWIFYLGPLFTLPLLFFFVPMMRKKWARMAALPIVLVVGSGLLKFGSPPHYSAPITGLVTALIVQSLRYLQRWTWRGQKVGLALASALLTLAVGGIAYGLYESVANVRVTHAEQRIEAETLLEQEPGQHLVLVRFGPLHGRGDHWIWNRADIDGSRVVWARDPGLEQLPALLDYFQGRRVWIAEVGFDPKGPLIRPLERNGDSY
ncbi:MAG TPA: hypothetical protein PLJ12_04610, partial [Planctomycetota bacterium]|nr:hypothetical protein [Planctomycetota bacterium]